jgi:hypothetical protein
MAPLSSSYPNKPSNPADFTMCRLWSIMMAMKDLLSPTRVLPLKSPKRLMVKFFSLGLVLHFSRGYMSCIHKQTTTPLFGKVPLGLGILLSIVPLSRDAVLTFSLGPTYYMATAAIDRNSNSSAVFKMIFYAGSEIHGASGSFLLSQTTNYPGANNLTIADILTKYYISFATTLDPNPLRAAEAPYWPSYIAGGGGSFASGEGVGYTVLDINYTMIGAVRDPDASTGCDFFAGQGLVVRN